MAKITDLRRPFLSISTEEREALVRQIREKREAWKKGHAQPKKKAKK